MANLDLLENSIPVAPLKLAALPGSMEMAKKVDSYLVQFRKELAERRNGVSFSGYSEDSFLIDCECPRFGSGEAKGKINESVRGADLYILVDVCNYSITYKVCGYENHMSPDDHYQDLKRIIAAATGKAHRINVIMPFIYEGRQHKRTKRESLDCALALQELMNMGVSNFITFDAHDPRVMNAIPLGGFDTSCQLQFLKALLVRSGSDDRQRSSDDHQPGRGSDGACRILLQRARRRYGYVLQEKRLLHHRKRKEPDRGT